MLSHGGSDIPKFIGHILKIEIILPINWWEIFEFGYHVEIYT